jgi:tetratricopeptide (TPR) repeat protein
MRLHRTVTLVSVLAMWLSVFPASARNSAHSAHMPVTTRSRSARKLFERAMVDLEALRTEQAVGGWRAAVREDPQFAQAFVLIGFLTTNPAEELQALNQAQRLAPKVTQGERLLIRWIAGVRAGDTVPAIAAMNDLLSLYPNDRRITFLAGRWLITRERYEQAEMLLERAVAAYPEYPAAINELGYAYAYSGQFRKAFAMMERYVELEPASPNPQDSYAEILRHSGDFEGALRHYREALKVDPKFVSSQVGVADTYALMGDEKSAREEYAKAIRDAESDSDRLDYQMQAAATYVREHRWVEADQAFRAVAHEAHDKNLARVEAEAYRRMAWYQPQFASAMQALHSAEQALDEAHTISASDRRDERAKILRVRAIRAAGAGNEEVLTPTLRQLQELADESRSQVVQRAYHAAFGAALLAKGQATDAVLHLEEDQDDPLSLGLLAQAYQQGGIKDKQSELEARSTCLNEPSIEQALAAPGTNALLQPVERVP